MISPNPMFDPGRLDRRIVLQTASVTRDAMGGEVITWVTTATVWARKMPVSGGRFYSAESKNYDASLEYTIRHRTDVVTGMRVVHGDDTFEIVSVNPGEARNRYLTLGVRAVNQSTGYAERTTTSTGDRFVTSEGDVLVTSEGDTLVPSP